MFRKISTFSFTSNKKNAIFILFFFDFFLLLCQSNNYIKIDHQELKKNYSELFQKNPNPDILKTLWTARYPCPEDTLIYQAKLNYQQENPLLAYYYQVQTSTFWAFLGIIVLNWSLISVIAPFIKWKKTFYTILLCLNLGTFVLNRNYLLFQEWVFLPSHSGLYESTSFASRLLIELHKPQMAIVTQKKDFWLQIETENGNYWIPEWHVIK